MFGGQIFQQTADIAMGTNCALLADLFLYSDEADFIQSLLKQGQVAFATIGRVASSKIRIVCY